jgi:hypothetical protein
MAQVRQLIFIISTLFTKRWINIALLISISFSTHAQTYTNVYNGINYTSTQPYNLNVIYFVPNDIPLDPTYKVRWSKLILWAQDFFRQNMISNGFGPISFGLFKEAANPNAAKIILINGAEPSSAYPYNDASHERAEIDAYFNANPSQKASEHYLVITAAKDLVSLTPSAGYYRVAWSVTPIGADSFYVRMPVTEISGMANIGVPQLYGIQNYIAYNLEFEFSLKNGDRVFSYYPYSYNNNIPSINVNFDDKHCDALCCGWTETNVGTREYGPTPGYVCYTAANNNNMRVKTYSTLYGTNDAFPFGYTSLTGDGSLVARVKNVTTNYNDYGGIMLRSGLNDNATYVSTGVLDTRGIYDQYRLSVGAGTGGAGTVNTTIPVWVKLQRKGNTISSFYSSNGVTWTHHQNYNAAAFGSTIQAGVFASNPTAMADIDFVGATPCTLPSGWQVADVGTVSAPGTACHTAATGNIHMES